MKHFLRVLPLLLLMTATAFSAPAFSAPAQDKDKPAYRIFTKAGKASSYAKMLAGLQEPEVVLFGELHNDPIAHWLQLELARDLHRAYGAQLVIGAEMFETDVQLVLDEFLAGQIPEANFEQEARPWPNYKTDYRPLVRFAKEKSIPFVATNVPRRYAALVAKEGLAALAPLSAEAKRLMAPLPITVDLQLPSYQKMLTMFGPETHSSKKEQVVQAQALKDATMASFILRQLLPGRKLLHLNGGYHSDYFEGIGWYLRQAQPQLRFATITTVQQDDLSSLAEEHRGKADFIIVVPTGMTRTH
ncbi:ChaN family lipoprotein [soil metagenome]